MPSTMAPLDDEWVSLHVSPEERLRIGPEMVETMRAKMRQLANMLTTDASEVVGDPRA